MSYKNVKETQLEIIKPIPYLFPVIRAPYHYINIKEKDIVARVNVLAFIYWNTKYRLARSYLIFLKKYEDLINKFEDVERIYYYLKKNNNKFASIPSILIDNMNIGRISYMGKIIGSIEYINPLESLYIEKLGKFKFHLLSSIDYIISKLPKQREPFSNPLAFERLYNIKIRKKQYKILNINPQYQYIWRIKYYTKKKNKVILEVNELKKKFRENTLLKFKILGELEKKLSKLKDLDDKLTNCRLAEINYKITCIYNSNNNNYFKKLNKYLRKIWNNKDFEKRLYSNLLVANYRVIDRLNLLNKISYYIIREKRDSYLYVDLLNIREEENMFPPIEILDYNYLYSEKSFHKTEVLYIKELIKVYNKIPFNYTEFISKLSYREQENIKKSKDIRIKNIIKKIKELENLPFK